MSFEFIQQDLVQRKEQGLFREVSCIDEYRQQFVMVAGKQYINFSGNDYLGLAQIVEGHSPLPIGSSGSSLVSGYSKQHQYLTDYLADCLQREAVILFSSGFAANTAICQALGNQGKTNLIADKLSHASIIEGALSSAGQFSRFKHNDLIHLQALLDKTSGDKLVLTEGVFSMDGDSAPVTNLVELCSKHSVWLSIDDAHGFGVLGENGFGTAELHGLSQSQLPILMGTFGKAIGTNGAFVAGSRDLIDYLTNFARHYVYSTALSPMLLETTKHNLKLCREQRWRRQKLQSNIELFKAGMADANVQLLSSDTAIQPVIIGDPQQAVNVADCLKQKGFWVTAIRHPTVPKNTDRIRITLSTMHESHDIENLVRAFKELT